MTASRARAAALWWFRATVEEEAASRFDRLARDLEAHRADPEVVALAAQAAADERRHHALCVELAHHFGTITPPRPASPPRPVTLARARARERLLAEVVAMSCVTESLSTALLIEMRRRAVDPRVREVVHEVLRDEVRHARLGWIHLAAEARRGIEVRWLADHLPAMLAATVHEEIFSIGAESDATRELEGLGGLDRRTRCETFVGAMGQIVFPGLERFGIPTDAGRRWIDRALSAQREPAEAIRELDQRLAQG